LFGLISRLYTSPASFLKVLKCTGTAGSTGGLLRTPFLVIA